MWNVLWRVWKWLVHLVTGKSELQRLAESSLAVGLKTWSIGEPCSGERTMLTFICCVCVFSFMILLQRTV